MESVEVDTQTRRISVTFERKLGTGDYGNLTARTWIEDDLQEGDDASQKAVNLLNEAKAAVYDTLGIEVLVDDSGVIREKHTPQTTQQAANTLGREMGGTPTSSIRIMNQDQHPGVTVPADIEAVCVKHGIDAVWANDGKYGVFFKERVKQGEEPKLADDTGRTLILKPGM